MFWEDLTHISADEHALRNITQTSQSPTPGERYLVTTREEKESRVSLPLLHPSLAPCLSICLSVCPYIHPIIHPFIQPSSIHPSTRPSIAPFTVLPSLSPPSLTYPPFGTPAGAASLPSGRPYSCTAAHRDTGCCTRKWPNVADASIDRERTRPSAL